MNVSDLRGILNYVPQYRDKVVVISIDGALLAPDQLSNLLLDIAVLWNLRIRIVLVHGIGHQLKQLSSESNTPISDTDGTGITNSETLALCLTAANRLTHEIMEGITSTDIRCIYANAIIASPLGIMAGVDHLFTGKVEKVDGELLTKILREDIVPVLPPLGFDGDGHTYRLNSDAVACAVAQTLGAVKLIFLAPQDKFTRNGQLVRQFSVVEAEEYAARHRGEIPPPLRSKVEHGIRACRGGVSRVHIVNGLIDEALLSEIFLNEGVGTMIYANEYQAVRPAVRADVRTILSLIKNSVDSTELVRRTRADVVSQLGDYYVFEVDRHIVGCVALHEFPEQGAGELACLFVRPSHENLGIGRKLMAFVDKRAREKGLKRLFALSTQAYTYLEQKGGFHTAQPEDLPPVRRQKWEQSGRNSRVLVRDLVRL
jgi:amino-acid N-acetyltransferase